MKKIIVPITIALIAGIAFGISSCKKNKDDKPVTSIFFSPSDDVMLGQQLKAEIEANPNDYPLLDEAAYPEAYAYINARVQEVLNSGKIDYKDEFTWETKIVHNDDVLNAFAAPGGFIYFYTGLIKYLDKEDDFMGVLGHEMAHADRRHSIKQLEKQYGISFLLSIATGNEQSETGNILAGLAGNLAFLRFSRNDETEADLKSVDYLSTTLHRCDGAATFFKKLEASGQSGGPVFLSTHPSPADRVETIRAKAIELNCDTSYYAPSRYDTEFRNKIPQ